MKMKKFLSYFIGIFILGFAISSCLDNESENEFTSYGYIPASQINFNADSIQGMNKPTNIHVTFALKNCQKFIEFRGLTSAENNISNVGIFGSQNNDGSCTEETTLVTKSFKFYPRIAGENIIRVWAGKNASGEDQYISKTINIPVE